MNPLLTPVSNPDGVTRTEHRRDLRQCDIVDDGLALLRVAGTLSTLEYLKSRGVDGRVIARVLLEPAKRRGRVGLTAI
jgi:hypothetical protein